MSTISSDAVRLAARLAIFATFLAGLQALVHTLAPSRDVPAALQRCDESLRQKVDVVYFGDSTLYRGDPREDPSATLPERLAARLPQYRLGTIAHDAYHPDLYAAFCRYFARQAYRPRAVIIPINLRAFSVERDRRPEYQFVREKWFLEHTSFAARAMFHPLAAWGAIDLNPITQQEYLNTEVFDGEMYLGTVSDLGVRRMDETAERRNRRITGFCYRYSIESSHRQLRALKDIVLTCRAAGILPVFYVTPINCDLGELLARDWFRDRIRANAHAIVTTVETSGPGAAIVDLSSALDASHFVLSDIPDAYLRSSGKDIVAAYVAKVLEDALKDKSQSAPGRDRSLGDSLSP